MRLPPEIVRQLDSIILLFLLAVFLLTSPFASWWSADDKPWYLPYLIWLGIILLAAWQQIRRSGHDL